MLKRIHGDDEPPRAPIAPPGLATAGERLGRYLFALVVLGAVVGAGAAALFETTECGGPDFDGECDMAGLVGIGYGVVAVAAGAVLIVVVELVRWYRKP